jgi:hypothetical protein
MVLVEHRHTPTGLYAQLVADGQGYYLVRVEFGSLAARLGFAAARMRALAYTVLLRQELGHADGCVLGDIDGVSRGGRPRRESVAENTFVSFLIASADGSGCGDAMTKRFRHALLWADQQWSETPAGKNALLECESYRHAEEADWFVKAVLAGENGLQNGRCFENLIRSS